MRALLRIVRGLAAVAALTVAGAGASAAATDALQPLANSVSVRHDQTDDSTARGRRERRRLEHLAEVIATPTETLQANIAVARRVGRTLRRLFPGDKQLGPLFATAALDLGTAADAERVRLGAWSGRLSDEDREEELAEALAAIAQDFRRAGLAQGTRSRLAHLRTACIRIDEARESLALLGDPPVLGPPMPDFSLPDVNANSPSHGRDVSPRDLLGSVGAWYFGYAT
jgi:hypothetical protein